MINPNDEIQHIVDLIDDYSYADARLAWLESYKSALKALRMKDSPSPSVAGKEMDALASEDYLQYCYDLEEAKRKHTSLKLTIETAKMKVELFRTLEASSRFADKMVK
jgi:hypothetical protein